MIRLQDTVLLKLAVVVGIGFICGFLQAQRQPSAPSSDPICEFLPVMGSADSLPDLSERYFGEPSYQWAILLATNAHASEQGFRFIRDPNQLPAGSYACIPNLSTAGRLRTEYDRYLRSVNQARSPTRADISNSLVAIDTSKPVKVVTWIRGGQLSTFRKDNTWTTRAPYDVWVTAVPMLRNFCRKYAHEHSNETWPLTERLEERLGLPPLNGKNEFVEFTITDPASSKHIFRPCVPPSVTGTSCTLGPPQEASDEYKTWFFSQYYSSYGTALPYPYPWTSLGYTFDWAQTDDFRDGRFVQFGESEFVVPKGAPIHVDSTYTTEQYCAPDQK